MVARLKVKECLGGNCEITGFRFGPSAGCGQPATAHVVSLVLMLFVDCQMQPFICTDRLLWGFEENGGGFQARQSLQALWPQRSGAMLVAGVQVGRGGPTSTHSQLPDSAGTHGTAFTNTTCPALLKSHTGAFALQNHFTLYTGCLTHNRFLENDGLNSVKSHGHFWLCSLFTVPSLRVPRPSSTNPSRLSLFEFPRPAGPTTKLLT